MSSQKIRWYLLFFLLFAVFGFAREFFFINMNNLMYMKYYRSESALPIPAVMRVFESFDYATLYYSKYFFTIAWVLLYYFLNYAALKKLTATAVFTRLLLYAYFIMLMLAAISMGFGYIINNRLQAEEYTLSRWLMGVAQSPLISLILLASEKLYHKASRS